MTDKAQIITIGTGIAILGTALFAAWVGLRNRGDIRELRADTDKNTESIACLEETIRSDSRPATATAKFEAIGAMIGAGIGAFTRSFQ